MRISICIARAVRDRRCFVLSALALGLSFSARAAGPDVKAQFIGGTLPGMSPKSDARLDLTGRETLLFRCGPSLMAIAYSRINTLEYGQNVSRRYAAGILISPLLLLSKSRKHFVTIGYTDQEERQQAIVLRVGKSDIRAVLVGLEARTGRRVEYQDDEARKSGK
jgi:hypothetical protein